MNKNFLFSLASSENPVNSPLFAVTNPILGVAKAASCLLSTPSSICPLVPLLTSPWAPLGERVTVATWWPGTVPYVEGSVSGRPSILF